MKQLKLNIRRKHSKINPLPVSVAVHHKKCQTADKHTRDNLHAIYLEWSESRRLSSSGQFTVLPRMVVLEERIRKPYPERPGFRRYTENG